MLKKSSVIVSLGMLLAFTACATEVFVWDDAQGGRHYSDRRRSDASALQINPGNGYYRVARVFDGDTIALANGPKVRLLGLNTPEVNGPYKTAERGGDEAKQWLTQRLAGQKVRIETDVELEDHYQRRLAYVFDEQGNNINIELVRNGLAMVSLFPPNLKYVTPLLAAQQAAESEHLGVWAYPEYAAKSVEAVSRGQQQGWQRIRGTISAVRPGEKHSYLQFSEQLSIQLPSEFRQLFPDPAVYQGRQVEVRGWLHRQKHNLLLTVRHPADIKVLD